MRFAFCNGSFDLAPGRCLIFGVLNVTPDSFSDGGRYSKPEAAVARALALEREGADAVDVGGESTRPGAEPVGEEEESRRVIPVIQLLRERLRIPISIDTTKAIVAEKALNAGAAIVNDVSGLTADPRMSGVAKGSGTGIILTHRRGTAATMQSLCNYGNVVEEVRRELRERLDAALAAGIAPERIILDPGVGFSKTREQNFQLLGHLKALASLGRPIMIGVSRKSFLGGEVGARGPATLAVEIWSWLQGIQIIRTHDVGATRRALDALRMLREFSQ